MVTERSVNLQWHHCNCVLLLWANGKAIRWFVWIIPPSWPYSASHRRFDVIHCRGDLLAELCQGRLCIHAEGMQFDTSTPWASALPTLGGKKRLFYDRRADLTRAGSSLPKSSFWKSINFTGLCDKIHCSKPVTTFARGSQPSVQMSGVAGSIKLIS